MRTSFLEKKIGLTADDSNGEAVEEVVGRLSETNQKQWGAVYYLLAEKFGKQDV